MSWIVILDMSDCVMYRNDDLWKTELKSLILFNN